jgi:glutathione S-transferase
MFTAYGMSDSGNCYKVRLALEQLALPYRWVEVDTASGETRTPDFLAMNPNGKVPTLQLEDGTFLAESNAILHYLAGYRPGVRSTPGCCSGCSSSSTATSRT